jgi:hypothetical protein
VDSSLRKKKIQEIVDHQSPRGLNTSENNLNTLGLRSAFLIPLSYLIFDKNNGRIQSKIQEYEQINQTKINPSSKKGQEIISKTLWKSTDTETNNLLLKRIEVNGQLLPGLITEDGIIIDGNRRFMALLELAKKYPKKTYYFIGTTNHSVQENLGNYQSIEINSLETYSRKEKVFFNSDYSVKFSLMCDLFSLNQTKSISTKEKQNRVLRFGDFKFDPKYHHFELSDIFSQYVYPFFYEFNSLDKLQINTISDEDPDLRLDGAFFDLSSIGEYHFTRASEFSLQSLAAISRLNNSSSIVAIKAQERFMIRALLENSSKYTTSPWEHYLNKNGFYLNAILGIFPLQPRHKSKHQIFIFTKNQKNKKIFFGDPKGEFALHHLRFISEDLGKLSTFICKKANNKAIKANIFDLNQVYSFSNLQTLLQIQNEDLRFDEAKKTPLKDVTLSINKIDPAEFATKVRSYINDSKFSNIVAQALGKEKRIGEDFDISSLIDEKKKINNSVIISPGRYKANSRISGDFIDFVDVKAQPLKTHLSVFLNKLLIEHRETCTYENDYEVELNESIRSEFFAIFIRSYIGQLSASSAHRWQSPRDYNNDSIDIGYLPNSRINIRRPSFSTESLSQMIIEIPSLETQDLVINAHSKIQQLKSSVDEYDSTLDIDPSNILSGTIDKIDEMLNLLDKLTDEERVKLMIKKLEGDTNEFKQSWRLPDDFLKGQELNKTISNKLKFTVMKVITSYLNANGGELLIGYNEKSSQIEGLEAELNYFFPNKNIDKQKDMFMHKFNESLKDTFDDYFIANKFIRPRFVVFREKIVLFVVCKEADRPCFIKEGKAKNILGNTFYRRIGDSSDPLDGHEMLKYIHEKWPNYKINN